MVPPPDGTDRGRTRRASRPARASLLERRDRGLGPQTISPPGTESALPASPERISACQVASLSDTSADVASLPHLVSAWVPPSLTEPPP